jgi:cytochrome c551/c552
MKRLIVAAGVICCNTAVANPPPYIPPAAVVPVYGAVAGMNQSNDELLAAIKELTAEVRRLREVVEAGNAAPPPIPPATDALAVARAACLSCHSPNSAADKGFSFQLFADDAGAALAPLNNRDRLRVVNRISDGSMPKGGKLSDADRKALVEFFRK